MKLIKYGFLFIILITIGILYDRYKTKIERNEQMDEYDLIKKYLLNESSLSKSKKPLLWIHLDYEINSRCWTSFGSRTNTNLNQPYLYLCLKDNRQIPLTPVQQPDSISSLEEEAADLAKFLNLNLENL